VSQIYEVRELLQRQAALRITLPAPASVIERLELLDAMSHVRSHQPRASSAQLLRRRLTFRQPIGSLMAMLPICGARLMRIARALAWSKLPANLTG
jgi:hypothetical protein